ncbi:MAG: MoxR family ATPase [Dehalococcoidia bacterium]|nr:MoxR family ATPase [Dehalococcoidia bacterium]
MARVCRFRWLAVLKLPNTKPPPKRPTLQNTAISPAAGVSPGILDAATVARRIADNIATVIVGKDDVIEQALAALVAEGHILVEDVPGVGKTMLARSIAVSISGTFSRIQFTPDLLPSDVTGVSVYNQSTGEFSFRSGPVAAHLVLADEINRATPKTQSALLEAMEERQVTVDGVTHPLPPPFLVIATQNSIEYEGTFPLPEAQLDRFLMRVSIGYPRFDEEITIIAQQEHSHPILELEPVATPDDVLSLQQAAQEVYVDGLVREYLVALSEATREHADAALGASPRASLGLFRTGRALALLRGRDYVLPDDIKELAVAVLAHRIVLTPAARMRGVLPERVVEELLNSVPVPGAR